MPIRLWMQHQKITILQGTVCPKKQSLLFLLYVTWFSGRVLQDGYLNPPSLSVRSAVWSSLKMLIICSEGLSNSKNYSPWVACWELSHTYTPNSKPTTVSSSRSISYCSVIIRTDCFLSFLSLSLSLLSEADLPSPDLTAYRSRRMWRKRRNTHAAKHRTIT